VGDPSPHRTVTDCEVEFDRPPGSVTVSVNVAVDPDERPAQSAVAVLLSAGVQVPPETDQAY
jgi:hypothetical protein